MQGEDTIKGLIKTGQILILPSGGNGLLFNKINYSATGIPVVVFQHELSFRAFAILAPPISTEINSAGALLSLQLRLVRNKRQGSDLLGCGHHGSQT